MAISKTNKTTKAKSTKVFSDAELEALRDTKRERSKSKKTDGLTDLREAIGKLEGLDKTLAEGIHAIVTEVAPNLSPKTWYGMPAWADADGKAVCFFTPGGKFKERYATLGFNANAKLDDGNMWPTSFALLKLGDAEKKRITDLVKTAIG